MTTIGQIMRTAPVIPVLVIDDEHPARELAEALVAGGRAQGHLEHAQPAAIDAIRYMNLVPGAIVGAGTVTSQAQLDEARAAGAQFIVSPGLTESLAHSAIAAGIPFLPGVATASDIMRGLDLGLTHFKFFPAEAAGGIKALKALAAPFAQCRFCPTGGITAASAPEWLALEPVLCVGGSWIVPRGAGLATVEALAREAAALAE